ncbi:flagellar biosynthesis anti-sigma factor FlgM [Congregibacter variabilis]|uniref:Negative regulator of flagellin synthesis n=1 Tax=Congregibacter variabilis TaxID=3081200 RepID=A0ABZ0I278_9GAMM|nr:flagellar biosynthesis anti-sigma factor FlgM [Congregibacter sp. IMCC43200]
MNPVDNNVNIRQTRSDTEQVTRRGTDVNGSAGTESSSATSGESVSITSTASDLLSLENQLRELPGVDQARVDSIRQAISDGSYEVDPARIVDSLLQSEVELG